MTSAQAVAARKRDMTDREALPNNWNVTTATISWSSALVSTIPGGQGGVTSTRLAAVGRRTAAVVNQIRRLR